jgi:hypothetical protein
MSNVSTGKIEQFDDGLNLPKVDPNSGCRNQRLRANIPAVNVHQHDRTGNDEFPLTQSLL